MDRLKEEKAMRAEAANRRFDEREGAKRVSLDLNNKDFERNKNLKKNSLSNNESVTKRRRTNER